MRLFQKQRAPEHTQSSSHTLVNEVKRRHTGERANAMRQLYGRRPSSVLRLLLLRCCSRSPCEHLSTPGENVIRFKIITRYSLGTWHVLMLWCTLTQSNTVATGDIKISLLLLYCTGRKIINDSWGFFSVVAAGGEFRLLTWKVSSTCTSRVLWRRNYFCMNCY